jgi:hypothetical protein
MLRITGIAAACLVASAAVAQTAQPEPANPPTAPSDTPRMQQFGPVIGGPAPAIVGLSPCENLIGMERDACLKEERARAGDAGGRSAAAGGSMGARNTAPAGSTR